jgi:hypothetical protein
MDHTTWLRGKRSSYESWLFIRKTVGNKKIKDPKTKRISTLPIQYTYYGSLPLSPSDQASVREWFQLQSIAKDPVGTLQRALDLPRAALLASPGCHIKARMTEAPQSIEDIVLDICAIPDRQIHQVRDLSHQLQNRLLGGWDPIPLYFIETVMPVLGYKKGLLVLWLRHRVLQRNPDHLDSSEDYNQVLIKGGFGEIGNVLGIPKATIRSWFTRKKGTEKEEPLLWRYATVANRLKDAGKDIPRLFNVPIDSVPLLDEDRKKADALFFQRAKHARILLDSSESK